MRLVTTGFTAPRHESYEISGLARHFEVIKNASSGPIPEEAIFFIASIVYGQYFKCKGLETAKGGAVCPFVRST
jgi:hypothetical protein